MNSTAGLSNNPASDANELKIKRGPFDADLFECYKNGILCDVVLIADDGIR